ncbi:MAG: diadenylate cyclase CdaA [Deltaproteobacteria bacterium]|nr:diadenylate cyclase CdaA [Deltaproteobacteria bacterium]
MSEKLVNLLATIRIPDFIDVGVMAVVIYRFLLLIRGTRAIPMVIGLTVILGGTYVLATVFSLDATGWLVENMVSSAMVILVVLFQHDIRNALAQVGLITMREGAGVSRSDLIDVVVQTAFVLAPRRIGALIAIEREGGLRDFIEKGKPVQALPTVEIMEAIFHTSSPLHDGSVIIDRRGRLAAAGCILPLTSRNPVNAKMGTRHRAAIGLSEDTDAVVVVVSEERGQVSIAIQGTILENLDKTQTRAKLSEILNQTKKADGAAQEHQTQPV